MRISMPRFLLLLAFMVMALSASAVVSEYSFTSAAGTYTEITGGTILGSNLNDDESFNAIPLGFTFTYNGVAYTEISIQTDAFLAFGPTVTNSTLAISSSTGTNNVVAALNRDIMSRDNGELSYLLSGTAPNRVFTIQWKNYKRIPTAAANDVFNFQIQLLEGSNQIKFVYGAFTVVNVTTARTVQVGLRGDSNTDFNNRTTQTDWSATVAGTANNANCWITDTIFPASGLTFTFAPAQQGTPPNPAQTPNPANNGVNVAINANLTWMSGGGTVDGYRIYLGTDNPPTNIVNGTTITNPVYDHPTNFTYNTMYYWKVVPFNTDGDAPDCPVWQFTTLADPTITTYPYEQNFDTLTVPALPLGWSTVNANADAYTWESFAGTAQSTPNSMRIRYNASLAMDDWLITPPMQFTAGTMYLLSFWYRANSATYPEALSVFWGNEPTAAALTNQLFSNSNITNATYQEATATFQPTAAGTYYIGFKGHSPANMFYLYLDSVTISEITDIIDPPNNLTATVNGNDVHLAWEAPGTPPPPPPGFNDGFETYDDFALTFAPWTTVDVDMSTTYGMTGITWPNSYAAQAYMVFNPSTTTPAVTDLTAHSGSKMAACFASTTPPNNDWLISPPISIGSASTVLSFWAKSYTAQYGLERFKVGISMGGTAPADFTIISGANYIQAPVDWTQYSYPLSSYNGQTVRFGIQCLSNDAFIFLVDDVFVGAPTRETETLFAVNASSPVGRGTRQTGTPVPAVTVPTRDRDLLGYKIYRDNVLIQTINSPTTLVFDDMDLAVGTYSYTVTAYYTGGESTPAGPVTAQIYPPNNPPTDVTATVEGNDVTINWESPEAPPTGQWITWCQDVLGNSIGTDAAVTFDVAHRFTQADLAAVAGGTISQVKFVPAHEACVYTVKVWTGGSATNAGTLVSSQVVTAPIIDAWNIAVLNTPVPIPSTGDVYIGFEVNTQGGYPAGCDSGPHIEGKGNMMYFEGAWTTLTALAPTLTYNWLVQTFVSTSTGMKQLELKPIVEAPRPSYPKAELAVYHKDIETRPVTGFKIYRDGVLLTTINDPLATTYTDMDLPNGTYTYGVTALHTGGESVPATVQVTVNVQLAEIVFQDGFETYENFANLFAPWTLLDVDLSATDGITGIDFPGSAAPMAYIIFNPSATTPPITTLAAHGGAKMAASFAATTPPNNDFLITPRVQLGTSSAIKFYAKSHTAQYGLERFRVGVSLLPTILPQGFQWINGEYTEAPIAWTEYVFDLSAYDNQTVRVALRCVSNDAVVFYVDDFSLHSNGGIIMDNDDPTIPTIGTRLQGNYPNPFNPETTIRFSVKEATPVTIEIYNTKGQLVKTLINEAKEAGNHSVVWNGKDNSGRSVSSGVYFYKMNAGKYSSTKKMIMMK